MVPLRERLLLSACALAAFGWSLAGGFHFDDYSIFSDPVLTSPWGWLELWRPLQTRPLTWFTFWLNYSLDGQEPLGYHLLNLLLHLGCVLLLRDVVARLAPARVALVAALMFAVHPLQSEAVNYIFARGNLLMTVFSLLALRSWMKGRHWHAAAWFLPALLAKEECAAFPLFLLLLHIAISRNRKELAPIASMGALALAAGLRVIWATGRIAEAGSGFGAGVAPSDYLAAQGWAILRYLRLFLIPAGFTVDPDIRTRFALVAWALLAALALIALRRFDRAREGFWFLGALALLSASSSVFPAADLAADRRMYLPLSALCVAAAYPLAGVRRGYLVAVVGILTLASIWRCEVWRTERSLWSEAARMAPEKVRPMIQLSRAVRPESALLLLENARKIAPDDPAVASALGRSYMESGMYAQALAEFGRALALSPGEPKAMNNRGAVLLALGQRDAAIADFHRALSRDPCLFDALINLRRTGIAVLAPAGCRFTAGQAQELRENVTAR